MAKITSIIDIGSNSARMAVFEKTSHFGFVLLKEIKSRVRISENAYENDGNLQNFAMDRAINALKEFKLISKSLKSRKIICVATSAVRDAKNKNIFLKRARNECGINIKVIDGEKEAFFGAVAGSNLLPNSDGITIDIGGGSTEFALIKNKKIINKISLKLGTVRLKELFFDKNDINGAKEYIQKELNSLPEEFHNENILGIGGTIRALSKIIMKRINYPLSILHGFSYNIETQKDFMEEIIKSDNKTLQKFGFKEDRLDVIKEGTLILLESAKKINSKTLTTSGVGVREGVFLADMLRSNNYMFPKNFNPSVKSIEDIYEIDKRTSNYEVKFALNLFDTLNPLFEIDEKYKFHLRYAIKLSNAGEYIDFYSSHKHTNYLLLNSLHYGFTHEDRLLIAKIIKYNKKRKIKKDYISQYKELLPKREILESLCYIFWITKNININLTNPNIETKLQDNELILNGENIYLAKEIFTQKEFNNLKISFLT